MKNLLLLVAAVTLACGTPDDEDRKRADEIIVQNQNNNNNNCSGCQPKLECWDRDSCPKPPKPPNPPLPKSNCTVYMGNTPKQSPVEQKKLFDQIALAQGCVVKDIFHVGDMSYGAEHLETFLDDFSPVLAKKPQAKFWPARGNEDRMWPEVLAELKSWFPYLPIDTCKSYYVKNGDLTTIVLDSEDYCSYDRQMKMVAENLTGKPVAIVMHGAAFTSYDNVPTSTWAREDLHEIIKGWNVTVFNGEARGYERNSIDGVNYVNPGSGGVCLTQECDERDYTQICKPAFSYVICTDMLQCSALDLNGNTIDFF